jgi:Uncharacterized conserved protein (DUF2190)
VAANECVMRSGAPTMVKYTPGGAIPAGEVIPVLGAAGAGGVLIAHQDLAAGVLGAAAIGGGVYEVTGNAAIAVGALVFWDDAASKASVTATGNRQLGYAITACTGDNAKFLVFHQAA